MSQIHYTDGQANRRFDQRALQSIAHELRRDILEMIAAAGSGHPGGSLSAIDIITYLYFYAMRVDPANPDWENRDRFLLSKGHCAPAWYVALARRGYFPKQVLSTLRDIESQLQGHPDMRKCPGLDMTTGSLGQGFSAAAGVALGAKIRQKDYTVFVVLSDGELQEGVVWEAAMAASHYRLDNLIAIVDNNRLQTDGYTAEIMNPNPIAEKWRAFGWETAEIDGHDFHQIHEAVSAARARRGKPHIVVAETVKGRGVASMENQVEWHSLGGPMSPEQLDSFLAELGEARER